MVSYILRQKRQPHEAWLPYFIRSRSIARDLIDASPSGGWGMKYRRLYFSWHGHLARFGQIDPGRLAFRSLVYRNLLWWRRRQRNIPRGSPSYLRHPFRGTVPARLEQDLERAFNRIRVASWAQSFWEDVLPRLHATPSSWMELAECRLVWAHFSRLAVYGPEAA